MQLIDALQYNRDNGGYPFHMPGHKRSLADDELLSQIYGIDITETEGFDNLHDAKGIIREAEDRAAALFGADETHFLVNGSTGGILAAVCGTVTTGDAVIIARNCHRSVYNAVMLSGAAPYIIAPQKEECFDIYGGVTPEAVESALSNTGNGRRTVVITSPTYEGIISDIAGIAEVCHNNGAVLVVDAAHGAHLGLSGDQPASPVREGADVVISGVHKTLPSMTQTALIHISGSCPGKDRVKRMLSVFMTSSPSYVLMASIDSMTGMLEKRGRELFDPYEKRLDDFYRKAEDLKHLKVLTKDRLTAKGSHDLDRGKIVVGDPTLTYSGTVLYAIMHEKYGICAEMAAKDHALFMTSIADSDEAFERLYNALYETDMTITADASARCGGRRITEEGSGIISANIKEALFREAAYIPVESAEGMIAADYVTIYPPGIPEVIPGSRITAGSVENILVAQNDGLEVIGLRDGEISVIWEKSSTS